MSALQEILSSRMKGREKIVAMSKEVTGLEESGLNTKQTFTPNQLCDYVTLVLEHQNLIKNINSDERPAQNLNFQGAIDIINLNCQKTGKIT